MRQLTFTGPGRIEWTDVPAPRLRDGHGALVRPLAAPAGVPAEVLCTLPDNVVDGYRAVAPFLAARPAADVLVVGGAGPSVGLYAVATAIALGAPVRYVDSDEDRCSIAARLGAQAEHHQGPWPRRFPRAAVTVSNTSDPQGLAATLRSTDDYGVCTSIAIFFGAQPALPLLEMYTKGVTLHLSRADSRRYTPEVAELVMTGKLRTQAVTSSVTAWMWPPPHGSRRARNSCSPGLGVSGDGHLASGQ